jgi:site-specific recombinase XerD
MNSTQTIDLHDLDFDQGLLFVRGGKGDKDRTTLFPSVCSSR